MTGLSIRVCWHIHDDGMPEEEAFTRAWFDWPEVAAETAERHQVRVVDTPRMRIVLLRPELQRRYEASRAVVCDAPVIRKSPPLNTE